MEKNISKEDRDWLENYEYKYRQQLKEYYENPIIKGLIRWRYRTWMDLAMAVVEKFGDEGMEIIRDARFKDVERWVEETKTKYGTDIQAIHRFYQDSIPWWEPIWDIYLGDLPKRLVLRMKCACGDYWKERIEQGTATRELCKFSCDVDSYFANYLNPKIKYELRKWIPDGYPYCEHVWELK